MTATLRTAVQGDAAEIARLAIELGYEARPQDIAQRLPVLLTDDRYSVVVAEASDGTIAGWVSGERRLSLETGTFWEITGLVVDSRTRRTGVGRALVRAIETWATEHGAESIRVRSNVVRQESHGFYESTGYSRLKTQHAYAKRLAR